MRTARMLNGLLLLFLPYLLPGRRRLLRLQLGLLVAPFRHQLADSTARRAELDRNDPRIADDFAAERADAFLCGTQVRHFHGEVVDAEIGRASCRERV